MPLSRDFIFRDDGIRNAYSLSNDFRRFLFGIISRPIGFVDANQQRVSLTDAQQQVIERGLSDLTTPAEQAMDEYGIYTMANINPDIEEWTEFTPTLSAIDDAQGWLNTSANRLEFPSPGGTFFISTSAKIVATIGYFELVKLTLASKTNDGSFIGQYLGKGNFHVTKNEVTNANTSHWHITYEWLRSGSNDPITPPSTPGIGKDALTIYVKRLA